MSSRKRSRLAGKIGSALFCALEAPFALLSDRAAERVGAALGSFLWAIPGFAKQKRQALANLKIAFPELADAERTRLAKKVFVHFGRLMGDFLRSSRRTDEEVLAACEVEGIENVAAAIAKDRGIIAITAHFGNWERFGHWATAKGWPLSVVARAANEAGLQERALKLREKAGLRVIDRHLAVRPVLRALQEKRVVCMLPDQNADQAFVPFFGKPAGTVLGPAVLHQKSGAPIVTAYCVRTGPCKYRMIIHPAFEPGESMSPEDIMTEINRRLEGAVREYPDQYLWLHDRWRASRRRGLL